MNTTSEADAVYIEAAEKEIWSEAIKVRMRLIERFCGRKDEAEHARQVYNAQVQGSDLQVKEAGASTEGSADGPEAVEKLVEIAKDQCKQVYQIRQKPARRQAFASALEDIRQYAPIFDVFTQGAPSAVAVCWGTIRVILEFTYRCLSFGQSLFNNICIIARRVVTIRQQLRYLVSKKQTRDSIVQLYASLLHYVTWVQRICQASRWQRMFGALKIEPISIFQNFCALAKEVEAQVAIESADPTRSTGHHEKSQKMLNIGIESINHALCLDARDQRLSNWLNKDLIPHSTPPAIAERTCSWIFRHPNYLAWELDTHKKPLLIRGQPGSGKSSLSCALAQFAAETHQLVIRASVLPVGTWSQTPASNLVVSLLAHIFEDQTITKCAQFPQIRNILGGVQAYGSPTAVSTPTRTLMDKLWAVLMLVPPLLLIIDGLDQLKNTASHNQEDSANDLVALLRSLPSKSSISLIVLTRPRDWITQCLGDVAGLDITEDITNADISILVSSEARLFQNGEAIKDDIYMTIQSKGSGDFNYAKMLIYQLQTARSVRTQQRLLDMSPVGVEAMYRELSSKKVASLGPEDNIYRSKMLYLVAFAQEPMTPEQLNSAVALDLTSNFESPDEEWFDPASTVQDLGEPFLNISEGKVFFRHDTIREFVLKFEVTADKANEFLLNVCLTKLTQAKYMDLDYCAGVLQGNLLDPRSSSTPATPLPTVSPGLYDHATLHWHEYALQLERLSAELWQKLLIFLFQIAFILWAENLFVLLGRGGLDPHLQRLVAIADWYKRLPDASKPDLSDRDLFLKPYHDASERLKDPKFRPELQFLPFIRMNGYLNNGGRTKADFEKALQYANRVVDGFNKYLGPRNRNTLNARLAFYQALLALRRPDEAIVGYQEILKIQEELFDQDDLSIYITMQWIGNCYRLLARLDDSREMLEQAVKGFKRIQGERSKAVLFVSMALANTLENGGNVAKASLVYGDVYDKWVTINGTSNLFSSWILTSFGSALRKQEQYDRAEDLLFEAFATRLRLLTLDNDNTVDSGLNLAVLYRQQRERDSALAFLEVIQDSRAFGLTFERLCEREHIRSLLAFDSGEYEEPRNVLTQLVMQSTGENREQNNRELLWVRLNLADAARDHGEDASIPSLFTELVVSIDGDFQRDCDVAVNNLRSPPSPTSSEEAVLLDTPRQLEVAEMALRLTRDKHLKEAQQLLQRENLKWARDKDFWFLGGGPKVDTDTLKYRLPSLADVHHNASRPGKGRPSAVARLQMLRMEGGCVC